MGTIEKLQNGQTVAEVFWEQLPDSAESIMTIPVNSTISVTISKESSLVWNLTFTVTTPNGTTETKTITKELTSSYENGIGTSAEWINEDPSNQYSKLFPLGNTGTVKFQSAKVNGNSIDDSSNVVHPIAMEYSNGSIAIYPSSLGADGESFTTTTNTNPNTNFNGYSRRIRRIINHIGNFQFGNTVSIKISAAWKY